jgi:hypothetical protein
MIYLAWYEAFYLQFYDEAQANIYAYYLSAPFFLYLTTAVFVSAYRNPLKDNKLFHALKESANALVMITILFVVFLLPSISGAIILTNNFRNSERQWITGKIIDKHGDLHGEYTDFEFTIETGNGVMKFDTDRKTIDRYKVGEVFHEEMTKGLWGLWSKAK